ncbi:glutamate carboxypeptidase 2-like [Amphiura filiformis]|uniref:glutamate carboxypeptidase 2-like n=1 Tax=Amphiura filiformis TaxID=82378 RepID=UPI003B2235FB
MESNRIAIGAGLIFLFLGLLVGFLIGWFSKPTLELPESYKNAISDEDPQISERLLAAMDPTNIRNSLEYLTNDPHVAGTIESYQQAQWVKQQWLDQGLDSAEIIAYKVLLSYPSDVPGEENRVQLLNNDGSVEFESQLKEKPLDPKGMTAGYCRHSTRILPKEK